MAVTFDAVGPSSAGQSGAAVTSLSWTHTVAAGPAAVVTEASVALTAGTFGATCAGSAMTQLARQENAGASGAGNTLMFGQAGVAAGAKTMTLTSSATSDMEAGSVSYAGADTTAPFGTPVTASGNSSAPAVTAPGTDATSMIAAVSGAGSSYTALPAGTSRWNNNQNSSSGGGNGYGADLPGGGTGAVSWTLTGGDFWGAVAVEIVVPVPSGSTSGPNPAGAGAGLAGGTGTWTSPGGITAAGGTAATWAVT